MFGYDSDGEDREMLRLAIKERREIENYKLQLGRGQLKM